jgi:hypothetical protein
MGNAKYDFQACAEAQKHSRSGLLPNSMIPYEEANRILDAVRAEGNKETGAIEGHPAGYFIDANNRPKKFQTIESKQIKSKPCRVHREKVHTFADGTVLQACSHIDCYWGKRHPETLTIQRKHSDGTPGGVVYASAVLDAEPEVEQEIEPSPDDARELNVDGTIHVSTSSRENDDVGIVPEPELEVEILTEDTLLDELEDNFDRTDKVTPTRLRGHGAE